MNFMAAEQLILDLFHLKWREASLRLGQNVIAASAETQ